MTPTHDPQFSMLNYYTSEGVQPVSQDFKNRPLPFGVKSWKLLLALWPPLRFLHIIRRGVRAHGSAIVALATAGAAYGFMKSSWALLVLLLV